MLVNRVSQSTAAGKLTDPRSSHAVLRSHSLTPLLILPALVLAILAFSATSASAAEPWWQLSSSVAPTRLNPGGTGTVYVTAENLGDLPVIGSVTPVSITDVLPAGVQATGVGTSTAGYVAQRGRLTCSPSLPATSFPASSVTCTFSEAVPLEPYESLEVSIDVKVEADAKTGIENEARISGGEGYVCEPQEGGAYTRTFCAGALLEALPSGHYEAHLTGQEVVPVSIRRPLTIGAGATPYGVQEYMFTNENEGGSLDTQAGSHPFQQTTTIVFNETSDRAKPPAFEKDLHFQWPAGLFGNTTVIPQCTEAEFSDVISYNANLCPPDTVIGVASVSVYLPNILPYEPFTLAVPLFNIVPARGEPVRVGFDVEKVPVLIDASVRTGRDYAVEVSVHNITQIAVFLSSRVTVWGVPGDPRHDNSRGWGLHKWRRTPQWWARTASVYHPCG